VKRFTREELERVAQALARIVAERLAEQERRDAIRRREGPCRD
jgi:hypothetical protein